MKRQWLSFIAIIMLAIACTKIDPPCRPGDMSATQAEADADLERWARNQVDAGKGVVEGSRWNCGADGWRKWDIGIPFRRIVDCVEKTIPISLGMGISMTLTECMWSVARMEYARAVLKIPDDRQVEQLSARQRDQIMAVARAAACLEQFRNVEVNADKHHLNRTGPTEWVPAVLWLMLQNADKAMAPAMGGGLLFWIKPGPGVEEACVDTTAPVPAKRCTSDDCPPPGSEPPGADGTDAAGGIAVPPGSTPGDGNGESSGDFQ